MTHEEIFRIARENCKSRATFFALLSQDQEQASIEAGMLLANDTSEESLKERNGLCIFSETDLGFSLFCSLLGRLEGVKGKTYQSSFMKRGESEIKANMDRKYDRIENHAELDLLDKLDTLGDMAVYAIKWMQYLCDLSPGLLDRYAEHIAKIAGDR